LNNSWYSNDDYCVDGGTILEYYCSGDYEQSQQQSCGTDGYGSYYCQTGEEIWSDYTDYFCNGGECNSSVTPEFQEDCDDSDGYVGEPYCMDMNTTVYQDYRNYFCSSGACNYSQYPDFVEDCSIGNFTCINGTCV